MSAVKRTILWIIGVLLALIIIAILFVAFFDWNRARPWLDNKVGTAIGRPFAINGDLTVHWSRNADEGGLSAWVPWPRFTARDITVANPPWATRKQFATLQAVRFSLSPLGLIVHDIHIPSLKLVGPDIDIERDKQGRNTWTFASGNSPGGWKLDIDDVILDRGTLRIDDAKLDLHLDAVVTPLAKALPFAQVLAPKSVGGKAPPPQTGQSYYFGWAAHGTWRGAKAQGSGKLGSVLALRDASLPYPLEADLKLRDLHIAFAGTLTDPAYLAALDLRLKMSGQSMAHLYALTGLALPATPPFETDGHLTGQLHQPGSVFHYEDFNGKVGMSDLHGSVTYDTVPARSKLSGTLTSDTLKFSDLAPLIGADSNKEKVQRGVPARQPADKLLPVEPFDTSRWRTMDADVRFTGKHIVRKAQLPIEDLSTHVVLSDGLLTLDPLRFGVAGGDLDGRVQLDGRHDPMRGEIRMSARSLQLKQMFPTVALMQNSSGGADADIALSGTGNSIAALLGGSNGEIKLLVDGGTVSDLLLEEAGLNLANIAADKLFGDKPVKINCVAADFVDKDGLLDTRLFVFDTDDAAIDIDGTINLKTEQLDFTMHPHSKGLRILSLRSPLYLRGTLKNPKAGVQKGPLLARAAGAAALGVVAAPLAALAAMIAPNHDQDNQCATLIAQMRTSPKSSAPK